MFSLKGALSMGLQVESNAATPCAMCSSLLAGGEFVPSQRGFSHRGVLMVYPKSSKSWMTSLVLKPFHGDLGIPNEKTLGIDSDIADESWFIDD